MTREEQARAVVLHRLRDELRHAMDMNAATGYQIDRRLPAPEVFERPGWQVVWANPDCWTWEIATMPELNTMAWVADDEPVGPLSIHTDHIRPVVTAEAEHWFHPGTRYRYGLGFHVPTRTWIVFHGLA